MPEPAGDDASSPVLIDLRSEVPIPRRADARLAVRDGEPLALAIYRVYSAELGNAVAELRHNPDRDRAVHESRKSLKRARAILRLVRDDVGHYAYRQENVVLRDAGRVLSDVRTAAVHAKLAQRLTSDPTVFLRPAEQRWLVSSMRTHHRRRLEAVMGDAESIARLIVTIGSARNRAATFPRASRADMSFAAVEPSVRRVYRRGHLAMGRAQAERTEHTLHEWRKRVKYLRHQLEALQQLWPDVVGGMALAAKDLGELLGDEHDLAELAEVIRAEPALVPGAHSRTVFLNALDVQRRRMQEEAFSLGAVVYAHRPRAFTKQLAAAWEHWRRNAPERPGPRSRESSAVQTAVPSRAISDR